MYDESGDHRAGDARSPELWMMGIPLPGIVEQLAASAEEQGWDGVSVADSHHLAGDPYVGLALAARETTRLQLGIGVTNPVTRHPAATAAAVASVHLASGGRAVLGLGRGDSALYHLGRAPAPCALLQRAVVAIRAYLGGDAVGFDELGFSEAVLPSIHTLGVANGPTTSSLHWLPAHLPQVPVEVTASGPRMIATAAAHADRVMLMLGADVDRVRWGIAQARAARPDVAVGAYVNVVAHPNLDSARDLAAGSVASFARYSVMHGTITAPVDAKARTMLERIHDVYDLNLHAQAGSPQANQLTSEFVEQFGIVGPAEHCIARLTDLVRLGVDKLVIAGPAMGTDPAESTRASQVLVHEVLPVLRSHVGG